VSGAIHSSRSRVSALIAAILTPVGAFGLALVDRPLAGGYVSEAGVAGAPHAVRYRLILVFLAVAAGAAALGLRPVAARAALALGLAAPGLLVSGAVRCSAGCPLPPYERATAADLLHAGASIGAVVCCALAMLAAALWSADPVVRAGSRWAVAVMIPVGTAMAAGLLFVGRGPVTGTVERICLAGCLAWVAGVSAVRARRPAADRMVSGPQRG
jgi:hypothetical protein